MGINVAVSCSVTSTYGPLLETNYLLSQFEDTPGLSAVFSYHSILCLYWCWGGRDIGGSGLVSLKLGGVCALFTLQSTRVRQERVLVGESQDMS